jgi:non-specific serine/threonine protein kinase/serine/threonine-protein kinase
VNEEQRERLKDLFDAARQLEPGQRPQYLAEACAGDEEVRREAESLLASLEAAGTFIESPDEGPETTPDPLVGSSLGPWRLTAEIARGGMGVVYRAVRDDESFRKEAAVKVLPAGVWTPLALSRFRSERAILARLEHPGIARLLDGGAAPDGRPYYVMELVEGEWIDRYCDRRGLGTRRRLELFAAVCDAVDYAHQNLVLHRDIKPGNILVTASGQPRLLDFGIAKLLDPTHGAASDVTGTELRALTPRYASPEQVTGAALTTASDVYSLGVLLYELLAGAPPYEIRTRSAEELVRVVCRQEPERPSTALRRVSAGAAARGPGRPPAPAPRDPADDETATGPMPPRRASAVLPRDLEGDLDWIVLKALRKEPERRYPSARDLAEDVRRHLEGRPVLARPDTVGYRAGKFVKRHRVATAAALLAFLAVTGGLGVSLWQWRRAESAHTEAEQRFDDVRRLAGSLLFEVHDAVEKLPGSTPVRALIVSRGVEYLDRLASSSLDPRLQAELVAGYLRLGDVQGRSGDASLGDTTAATASYRKAVRLADGLVDARASVEQRELLARACARLAEALRDAGEREEAAALLARSVALLETAVAAEPGRTPLRSSLAARRFDQGAMHAQAGEWEEALASYGRAAELYEALAATEPSKAVHRRNLALAHKYIGGAAERLGRLEESRRHYESALAADRELLATSPQDPAAHLDLSYDLAALAKADERAGRIEPAVAGLREALALRQWVLGRDPLNVQARAGVARAHGDLAGMLHRHGDWAAADAEMRRCVAERERVDAQARGHAGTAVELAKALDYQAEMLVAPARPASAAREAEACVLHARSQRLFALSRDGAPKDQAWTERIKRLGARCRARDQSGGTAQRRPLP